MSIQAHYGICLEAVYGGDTQRAFWNAHCRSTQPVRLSISFFPSAPRGAETRHGCCTCGGVQTGEPAWKRPFEKKMARLQSWPRRRAPQTFRSSRFRHVARVSVLLLGRRLHASLHFFMQCGCVCAVPSSSAAMKTRRQGGMEAKEANASLRASQPCGTAAA